MSLIPNLLHGLFKALRRIKYRLMLQLHPAVLEKRVAVGREVRPLVPVRCDGKGKVSIGDFTTLGWPLSPRLGDGEILLQARVASAVISVGSNVAFSNNVSIIALESVSIGNDCLLGDLVTILDSDFHEIDPARRRESSGITKPVAIGNNVWFGSRVMVLKGVAIGDNSVIAPQSVVTRDIPANCIAGGNPAKVIRYLEASA